MGSNQISNYIYRISLIHKLIILLIVMLLPFVAFSIYKAIDINQRLEKEYKVETSRLANNLAHDIDEYITSTGEVLIPIASHDDVRAQNFTAVKAYLDELVPKYPFYHLIAFVDLEGNVRVASMSEAMAMSEDARKVANQVSVRDTACYRRGIEAPGVAVGDFMYSKLTKMPVVHVTYPVFDHSGKRIGFVAAAFDLTKIQKKLMNRSASQHTAMSVVDDKGIFIARSKDPEEWVGKSMADKTIFKKMLPQSHGTYKIRSVDGKKRLYSFAVVPAVQWYARAGVDEKFIHDQVMAELLHHFAVFIPLLLIAFSGWLWIGRDVDRLHKKTEELSLIDALTGLWNCRRLNEDLFQELSRAKRYREYLSFAMIDIDHFKQYNDHNGHQLGDEALRNVADTISNAVRDTDIVYRYGGEELCVCLPKTDTAGALTLVERIRRDIEQTYFLGQENQPAGNLTVSIGVATYPYDSISKEGLVKCADDALYQAKHNGRNRVEVYSEDAATHSSSNKTPESFCSCI